MKSSCIFTTLTFATGVGLLAYHSNTSKQEITSTEIAPVSARVQHTVVKSLSGNFLSGSRPDMAYFTDQELLRTIVSKSWNAQYYEDYGANGKTNIDIERYRVSIEGIEELLRDNPGLLDRIAHEIWWQKYLAGELAPEYVLLIEMRSFLAVEKFASEEPEIYVSILTKSPRWETEGRESAQARENILNQTLIKVNMTESNPGVVERMTAYGYNYDDIYRVASIEERNFYDTLDTIQALEDPNLGYPEVREQFFASDTGKAYLAGKIDPLYAYQYFNELMIKYTENIH